MLNALVLYIASSIYLLSPSHAGVIGAGTSHMWATSCGLVRVNIGLLESFRLCWLPFSLRLFAERSFWISAKQVTVMISSVCFSCIYLCHFAWAASKSLRSNCSSASPPDIAHNKLKEGIRIDSAWNVCEVIQKFVERNIIVIRVSCLVVLVKSGLEFFLNFALRSLMRFDVRVTGSGESRNDFL